MARKVTDSYHYQNGDVALDFAFERDANEKTKKKVFVEILKSATADLEAELAEDKN